MGLETGTYISDLVTTNPVGATDPKSQGDDHLRLLKSTIKATFPNITGAVTMTHTQLNGILSASNLTSGSLPDARLSANVPLLNAANTFSAAAQAISVASGSPSLSVVTATGSITAKLQAVDSTGVYVGAQSAHGVSLIVGNDPKLSIDSSANFNFFAGQVTTSNASASEVGFKGTPQNVQNGDYTLVLSDAGKAIVKSSGGAGETITVPANASVAFPVGTIIRIVNGGGGDLTIAITSDTMFLAGAALSGSRTLVNTGVAVLEKFNATVWLISGAGLS